MISLSVPLYHDERELKCWCTLQNLKPKQMISCFNKILWESIMDWNEFQTHNFTDTCEVMMGNSSVLFGKTQFFHWQIR